MRTILFYFAFLLMLLSACADAPKKQVVMETPVQDTILEKVKPDTAIEVPDTFHVPSHYFIEMLTYLDSSGFIYDTSRAKKVGYYWHSVHNTPVFMIKNFTLYKLDTSSGSIFGYAKYDVGQMNYELEHDSTFKSKIEDLSKTIHKVKNISGYFFRDKVLPPKNSDSFISDGFLEEWEFNTKKEAVKATTAVHDGEIRMSAFPNSISYVFGKDKYMYIFYSRSDWDATRLCKIMASMIKKQNAFEPEDH